MGTCAAYLREARQETQFTQVPSDDDAWSVDDVSHKKGGIINDSSGDDFVAEMVYLLTSRVLNSRQLFSLMYQAGRAGIPAATKYGLAPWVPSVHCESKTS